MIDQIGYFVCVEMCEPYSTVFIKLLASGV